MTYTRAQALIKAIRARQEKNEYAERLHIAVNATATIKYLFARLNKVEMTVEEMIGKPPDTFKLPEAVEVDQEDDISLEAWKEAARAKGLKIQA